MRIIVVGCGKIGKTIIGSLIKERHEVIAVDKDRDVIEKIATEYDVKCICANGAEYDSLVEIGAETADIFIAVTTSDESNMLSCFVAKKLGAKHTVARIRDIGNSDGKGLRFLREQFGLSMTINPERLTASAIYNVLKLPSAVKAEVFPGSKFEISEAVVKQNSLLCGVALKDVKSKSKEKFLVSIVNRGGNIYIPDGRFTLASGDKVAVIAAERNMDGALRGLTTETRTVKQVMILGASKICHYLCEKLTAAKISCKVIDVDKERCFSMCEEFPSVSVICGNGMNGDLLLEEGITDSDAFVSLTGRDEDNILISFYASNHGVKKVVAKVNNEEMSDTASGLGLDCIVSPKDITADYIIKYARSLENATEGEINALYSLAGGGAEAVEFCVKDFEGAGIPLKNLKLKNDVLIGGIIREGKNIIPCGDDVISEGDRVIVVATGKRLTSLGDILR